MQLNKVRSWNVNLKIVVTFLSILLLPSIFVGIVQTLFYPSESSETVVLFHEKSELLAKESTKNGSIDYTKVYSGVTKLIPELSPELLDTYFYFLVGASVFSFILIGVVLAHFLFPKGIASLGFENKKPMMFFGAFVTALNVPILASDALGINEILGVNKLQEFLFGSDVMMDAKNMIEQLVVMFPNDNRGYLICWIGVALIPAIGEEIIFRGVLQRLFNEKLGNFHNGIALSAFIFAAFHANITNFFYLFIFGVILGYIYHWGKSIVFPIIIHIINNTMVLLSLGVENPYALMAYISIGLILFIYYMNFKRSEMEGGNIV